MYLVSCSKSSISVLGGKVFGGLKIPVKCSQGSRKGGDHDRGAVNVDEAVEVDLNVLEAFRISFLKRDRGGKSGVIFAASLVSSSIFLFAARMNCSSLGHVRVIVGITKVEVVADSIIDCVGVDNLEESLLRYFRNSWPVPTLLP